MTTAGILGTDSRADGALIFPLTERAHIFDRIADSLEYIRAADPKVLSLIQQLIGTIAVCRQSDSAGGSAAALTGMVWLNPRPTWTIVDYAEVLVHEYLHNSMFLVDMVDNVFRRPVDFDRELVPSAIIGTPRPFDRAFHSAFIVTGLNQFLLAANQSERANRVLWALDSTLAALQEKRYLLTEHGEKLLDDLIEMHSSASARAVTAAA